MAKKEKLLFLKTKCRKIKKRRKEEKKKRRKEE